MKLVGIDLSADSTRTGVCVLKDDTVEYVGRGSTNDNHPKWILNHCVGAHIVAVDVPFGWPKPFIRALATYRIGTPLDLPRQQYQLRATDLWVKNNLPPLSPKSVSTDKLGSTAIVGTGLLHALIEAGFQPSLRESGLHPAVIEVYPAASLRAWNQQGYARDEILGNLQEEFAFTVSETDERILLGNDHCFDALVAALTAWEYSNNNVLPPEEVSDDTLEIEGWIWVPDRAV